MRKIKNRCRYLKDDTFKNDYYKPLNKVTLLLDVMQNHITKHRILWDNKEVFIRGWLKGILTSTIKSIKSFNELYGDKNIITSQNIIIKKHIENIVDNKVKQKILNEYVGDDKSINYDLFITVIYINIARSSLKLSLNDLSNKHRKARQHLDKVLNQLDIYLRWWKKEIDTELLELL